jgi:predicted amidohydrolase
MCGNDLSWCIQYHYWSSSLGIIATCSVCSVIYGHLKLWPSLIQSSAVDNEMYVAACSPARDDSADYKAWGHSTIVDPKGQVLATCEEKEAIIYATIG